MSLGSCTWTKPNGSLGQICYSHNQDIIWWMLEPGFALDKYDKKDKGVSNCTVADLFCFVLFTGINQKPSIDLRLKVQDTLWSEQGWTVFSACLGLSSASASHGKGLSKPGRPAKTPWGAEPDGVMLTLLGAASSSLMLGNT